MFTFNQLLFLPIMFFALHSYAAGIYMEVERSNDPFVFCTEGSKDHNVIVSAIPGLLLPVSSAYAPPLNYPPDVVIYLEIWPTGDRPDTDNYGLFGIPLPPYYNRAVRNKWLGLCTLTRQGEWSPDGTASKPANQTPFAH